MRYQVKEALERISNVTEFHPNSLRVHHTEPNQIHVKCTDDSENEYDFKYSSGEVLMWDAVEKDWVKVQDSQLVPSKS